MAGGTGASASAGSPLGDAPSPRLAGFDMMTRARLGAVDHDTALLHLGAMRLGRIVEAFLDQTLRLQGIDRSGHSAMLALWFEEPPHQLSPTQLSLMVIQTTSGMTKTIRRLQQAGLVERTADPSDGRGQLVRLTPAGLSLVERHTTDLVARWDEHLEDLDGPDRTELAAALWSLLGVVDPLRERPGPD